MGDIRAAVDIGRAVSAPTPMAGLPEEYAAFTIPGPPVARISRTGSAFISSWQPSRDGMLKHATASAGAPAACDASDMICAAFRVQAMALG